MSEKPLQAVIWDMDGVIADTGKYHLLAWQSVFNRCGVVFSEPDFERVFGQRNDTIISNTLGKNLSRTEIDSIANDKEVFFRAAAKSNVIPFPGVIALLKTLKTHHITSAIASSAPLENIRLVLGETGLTDCFQAIVFGREVSEGKPDPQVYLKAAQKLGAAPSNCIVIEDAVAGVEGAGNAGMKCIAVTNTHNSAELNRADLIVDSLEKVGIGELKKLFTVKK